MTPLTVANFTDRQLIPVFISICPSSRAHQQETTWRSAELATAWINKANGASLAGKEQSFQYFPLYIRPLVKQELLCAV